MLKHSLLICVVLGLSTSAFADRGSHRDEKSIWKNPPTDCIENLVQPDWNPNDCEDLSKATDLDRGDFWGGKYNFCRAREAMKREAAHAGSVKNSAVRTASVIATAHVRRDEKIALIYAAANRYEVPPQMVFNALNNESLTSEVGMLRDFDNYSCGTGSLNLNQWCKWGLSLTEAERITLGFPENLACDDDKITSALIKPLFFRLVPEAESDLFGAYLLNPKRIAEIPENEILASLPPASESTRADQLTLIRSYTSHCADLVYAIPAAAHMLRDTFDTIVPKALRKRERYHGRQRPDFAKTCSQPYTSKYYPFHTGWVLAYAIHNIGEEAIEILNHYYTNENGKVEYPKDLSPQKMMHAIYFGGKYDAVKNQVIIDDPDDRTQTKAIDWLWPCDASFNIKNLIHHSMPDTSPLFNEGSADCNAGPDSARRTFEGRARFEVDAAAEK